MEYTSFIDGYMRFFLGIPGQVIFDLAKQYREYIYGFGMVYGVFMTIAAYNYRKILPYKTKKFMLNKVQEMKQQNSNISHEEMEQVLIDEWKKMINKMPKYMCIVAEKDYWVVWPDGEKYALKLNIDRLYIKNLVEKVA